MAQILTILLMIVISTSSWAQRSTLDQVREGMDYIYNLEFKKSQATIEQIESSLQNSAIPDLMKALQAFWKYYPIHLEEDKVESLPGPFIQIV